MKKHRKLILAIPLLLILGIAAYIAYIYFSNSGKEDPWKSIPSDAIFALEVDDIGSSWNKMKDTQVWSHLMSTDYFSSLTEDVNWLDSLINHDKVAKIFLKGRKMIVSAHMISANDYDYLTVVDIKKMGNAKAVFSQIKGATALVGYTTEEIYDDSIAYFSIIEKGQYDALYVAIEKNVLMISYSQEIIRKSLKSLLNGTGIQDDQFVELRGSTPSEGAFRFFFNFDQTKEYANIYLSGLNAELNMIEETFKLAGLDLDQQGNLTTCRGFIEIPDSVESYFSALSQVNPARSSAHKIASKDAAIFASIAFDNFDQFYKNITGQVSSSDSASFGKYQKYYRTAERLLGIDFKEDFFSWIGNEIVLSKPKVQGSSKQNDAIILIHANDIEAAKNGMGTIVNKIENRTPLKMRRIEYINYSITQVEVQGMFRMFFGNLVSNFDKPYYTFIEDFAVFSNSPDELIKFINDYIQGYTLHNQEDFNAFKRHFSSKSNVMVYIQMPKVYKHLYHFSKADQKSNIKENKELINSFALLGLQLTAEGGRFKTTLIGKFDSLASFNESLEVVEIAAQKLFNQEFESLEFKPQQELIKGYQSTYVSIHDEDSLLRYQGELRKEKPHGLWKTFYPSGNLKSQVNYSKGEANGEAVFYYDGNNLPVKATITFKDDQVSDIYREFFNNGQKKASLEYKRGKAEGDALFFYPNGALRIEGSYSKGSKSGNWKYYTENGVLMNKEKAE